MGPLVVIGGAAAAGLLMSKKPNTAAPPLASNNSRTSVSAQPGISSWLTKQLQSIGVGNAPAQTTNQTNYGGSKQFMGPPAAPASSQIAKAAASVNWSQVGQGAASVWDSLFGSSGDDYERTTDDSAINDYVDPQPPITYAENGADSWGAGDVWGSSPDISDNSDFTMEA